MFFEGFGNFRSKTFHVRNLTDVDDKTIRQSQEEGVELKEFTDRWTKLFEKDCEFSICFLLMFEPSAVGHIPEQISLIEKLIEKGKAYQAGDGSVYFNVDAFEEYGRFPDWPIGKLLLRNRA